MFGAQFGALVGGDLWSWMVLLARANQVQLVVSHVLGRINGVVGIKKWN